MEYKYIFLIFYYFLNVIYANINLTSFDVRERFYDCIHDYVDVEECKTNLPMQLTILASDKLCIKKEDPISPENIISCMNFTNTAQTFINAPYTCSNTFANTDPVTTLDLITAIISFLNKNGTQFKSQNPYAFNKTTKSFPNCSNYNSSLGNITFGAEYLNETTDLEKIKTLLYTEGPLLGYFNVTANLLNYKPQLADNPIYVNDIRQKYIGFYFFRIIGWQQINTKTVWTVTSTQNYQSWGMFGYGLIEQQLNNMTIINLKINK